MRRVLLSAVVVAACYGSAPAGEEPCEGGPDVCFGAGVPTQEQCEAVCALFETCHGWDTGEREDCEASCRVDDGLGFAACVDRAATAGECDQADACFGDLVQPPAGYCEDACAMENDPCGLIEAAEISTCVDLCSAGGQTESFYECRQEAVGRADCDAYLACASE